MHPIRNILLPSIMVIGFATVAFAEESKPARRLESVTWNPVEHKLTWTVVKGTVNGSGKFEGAEKASYEIDMDAATMSVGEEDRRFSNEEAISVHKLMDLVSKYAAESTVWWDAGKGEPLERGQKVKPNPGGPHDERQRRRIQPAPHDDEVEPASRGTRIIRIKLEK